MDLDLVIQVVEVVKVNLNLHQVIKELIVEVIMEMEVVRKINFIIMERNIIKQMFISFRNLPIFKINQVIS